MGKYLVINVPLLPWTVHDIYKEMKEKRAEEERIQREEEEDLKRREEEKREKKERKKERKRNFVYDEKSGEASGSSDHEAAVNKKKEEKVFKLPRNANQIWTDVDLAKLARLIKKYPAGTPDRWERIAEMLERLPPEVTKMAKKIKDNAFMVPVSQQAQGITGLEEKKLVSDDVMEDAYNDEEDEERRTFFSELFLFRKLRSI